ncbi:hypothetical protein J2X11_000073 [Aeromicrobium panaciterrae]|uniref:Phosphopantetheine adenylyltransferase n=1 Tax=Aeromicrobium panaciterrae TaxID=363861 RepID=A0ABU1UJ73_9ACTN|nr:hypothetical protein [Aeromicrobium panaciterrae]MDR7085234.1 hypothetical protein [Aeromicrobium panaciterrae]
METVIIVCLAGSALIHLLPLVGAFGPAHVARMYDVKVEGPDLTVLLVHRAVLFGLLGAALIAAIFCGEARPYVIGAVLVSDVAFLAIAGSNPGINDSMKRVVRADVISIVLLVVAGVSELVR